MEVYFRSPAEPHLLSLREALAKDTRATIYALRDAVRCLPYYPEELLGSFEAILTQECLFRDALRDLTPEWIPTQKEENIIHAAHYNRYAENAHIERAFFDKGKLAGIVALILMFKRTESIRSCWASIDPESQDWLVQSVAEMTRGRGNVWMKSFQQKKPPERYEPPYLGAHPEKRKSDLKPTKFRRPIKKRLQQEQMSPAPIPATTLQQLLPAQQQGLPQQVLPPQDQRAPTPPSLSLAQLQNLPPLNIVLESFPFQSSQRLPASQLPVNNPTRALRRNPSLVQPNFEPDDLPENQEEEKTQIPEVQRTTEMNQARRGIGPISTLLNHDDHDPATPPSHVSSHPMSTVAGPQKPSQ